MEAFVGIEAFRYLAKERALVLGLTDALKVQPDQLTDRVPSWWRSSKRRRSRSRT